MGGGLSPEAEGVLAAIPRVDGNPPVILGRIKGKAMRNLNDPLDIIWERAGLEDMRIHDARHSFPSRVLALGESPPMIGKLLGHTQVETTARYALLAEDSVGVRQANSGVDSRWKSGGEVRCNEPLSPRAVRRFP